MTFDPNRPTSDTPGKPDTGRPQPVKPMAPSFIPASVAANAANANGPKGSSKVSPIMLAFVAALVVAAAGLGFAGGRLTAPASTGRGTFGANAGGFVPGASGAVGRNGFGGGAAAFGGGNVSLTGQVTAIADGQITIQTSAGQNVTVAVPSTVTYHSETSAASTDVAIGTNVQLTVSRPAGRGAEASGAPGASPAAGGANGSTLAVTDILVLGK